MARGRSYRVVCGHEGCNECAFYEPHNAKERADLDRRYSNGQWRCTRHTRPDETLSASAPVKTIEIVSREEPHGRYFGNSGFVYGPGFKAWACDFPPGTVLKVTAEVVLPPIKGGE